MILQAVVADIVCAEEDGELEDVLFFHTFGKRAFLCAISKKAMPTLLCVGLLLSSLSVIWSVSSFYVYRCLCLLIQLDCAPKI